MNSKPWTRSEKHIWTFILTFGCALAYATRTAVPVTISEMAVKYEWSKTTCGGVLSSFFWGYLFTQILGGYLADWFGGDVIMWIFGVAWTLFTLAAPYIPVLINPKIYATTMLTIFTASRVLFGLAQGIHFPATSNLISTSLHVDDKAFVSGIVYSGGSLGIVLCGFISSVFLEAYGWQSVFTITGLASAIWLILLRYMSKRKNCQVLKPNSPSSFEAIPRKPFPWSVFRHKPFWAMICAHMTHDNSWYITVSWLPTFFHETHPSSPSWLFNTMPFILSPIVAIFSASVSERMRSKGYTITFVRKFMHSISQLCIVIPLLIVGRTSNFSFAMLLVCIAVGGASVHSACLAVNPQDLAPEYAGSLYGLMNTASAIPGLLGVYLAGYIQQSTGQWAPVFDVTASLSLAGLLVFVLFGSGKPIIKPDNKSINVDT